MIHVSRISYELGLSSTNFDSRNKDLIPVPVLKRLLNIPESKYWVLEEDPVFNERFQLGYCKTRRIGFGRFRYSRINLGNLR